MALTAQQQADTRRALGWPARFHQYDSRLEMAFRALETEPEHETHVIELLASIADIKTKLVDAHKRLKAVQVGNIVLSTLREELAGLRWEGRRFTGELSSILGVPRRYDIFGSGSFGGFAGPYGQHTDNTF